jgi:hypothetical protein
MLIHPVACVLEVKPQAHSRGRHMSCSFRWIVRRMAYPYSTKSPPRLLKLRYINHKAVNTNGCNNPQAAAADSRQPALHSAASIASAVRPKLPWSHSREGKDLRRTIAGRGAARPASTHHPCLQLYQTVVVTAGRAPDI